MPTQFGSRRAACVLAATLATTVVALAPTALARQGVYGGSTKAGDPIVLTSDAKGQKLVDAVFRIRVDGKENWWPLAGNAKVRPAPKDPMSIPMGSLTTDRNAGGHFAAKLIMQAGADGTLGGIELKGTLKAGKATGTLKAGSPSPIRRRASSPSSRRRSWSSGPPSGRWVACTPEPRPARSRS